MATWRSFAMTTCSSENSVIPAQAGIQDCARSARRPWVPPFAGTTDRLFRRFLDRRGERFGAGPAVFRDVEQYVLRPVELLLEIARLVAVLALVDVMLGAEAFEFPGELLDVLDQHPEVMDAAEIHALAELVGLELQDRHVEGAVGQKDAVGEMPVRPADLLEIERLLVELGHRLRVFGGDRDVTELGHDGLLALRLGGL